MARPETERYHKMLALPFLMGQWMLQEKSNALRCDTVWCFSGEARYDGLGPERTPHVVSAYLVC